MPLVVMTLIKSNISVSVMTSARQYWKFLSISFHSNSVDTMSIFLSEFLPGRSVDVDCPDSHLPVMVCCHLDCHGLEWTGGVCKYSIPPPDTPDSDTLPGHTCSQWDPLPWCPSYMCCVNTKHISLSLSLSVMSS